MNLSDQIELAGSHMSWMHELRGPNGEWIHTAALNVLAKHVKVEKVKKGDAILAWNGRLRPQEVTGVEDKGEDVIIHARDHDLGQDAKYLMEKGEDARIVGTGGVPVAGIRDIRKEQAKAQDALDKLAAAQNARDRARSARLETEPPRGDVDSAMTSARKQLDDDIATGIKSESKPHAKKGLVQGGGNKKENYFGNTADTQVVTFNNGHKWVRKRNLPQSQKSNEYLASLVGRAIGAGAPLAFRRPEADHDESQHTPGWSHDSSSDPLWMQYVSGAKPAIEWMGGTDEDEEPLGDSDPYDMMITPEGRKIGILDDLTNNPDRHYGNWMVAKHKDGTEYPVPIDHGLAGNYVEGYEPSGVGPFGEALEDEGQDGVGAIKSGDWAQMERNLKTLERDFEDEGRHEDFEEMMETFRQLRQNGEDYNN